MLTRHAKVRGQHCRPRAPVRTRSGRAGGPRGRRATFVGSSTLPRAAWPRPLCPSLCPLEGGRGGGALGGGLSRPNRTATASARRRCGCQAGRLARKQVLAAPGAASRPGARCTALGAPCPPTLPPQPLAWAGHCGPSSVSGTAKAPGRSRGPMGPPAGRCPRSLSDQAESGEILLLLPAALSCAASGNPIFSSSAVYTTGSGETSGTCPLSVKRFVKCHIHNVLK